MRILLSCVFMFVLLPFGAHAQKTFLLSGGIRDINGMPVPHALVVIEGSPKGAYANTNGSYSLEIPTGTYSLQVTAVGYKSLETTIYIGSNTKKDFVLDEQLVELQTVSVFGKTRSQQLHESSFTVNAIEMRQLTSSLSNLNTALDRSSGIKIRENGGLGSDFDLSINGLSGNSIRYFIDGVPLSSIGNGASLANLPVNIVERIEVYKGVVPADLGSDALGGAINLITKKETRNYLDASYGIGSFGTHKADFSAQYMNPRTGMFIQPSVGINYSKNNYEMRGVEIWNSATSEFEKVNLKRFHDDYFSVLTQLKMGITNKNWTDQFSVSASWFSSDNDIQTGSVQSRVYGMAKQKNESYNISGQYQKKNFLIRNLSANFSLSHTWDNLMVIDTVYRKYRWDGSYTVSYRNEITGRGKSIRHIERPLTIGRVNFNYSFNQNHSLNINYLGNYLTNNRFDDVDTDFEPSKDNFNKHVAGISYSQSFWQDKWSNNFFIKEYISQLKIGQQDLSWITGSDEIASTSSTNNWGAGIGSRFRFFDELALKSSFEHSVRLPLAREYLGNGTTIYPNFKLSPENSSNFNMGSFGTIDLAHKSRLNYEFGFFYRKVEDYIRLVISEAEGMSQYDNVNNVTIKGIEGELRYDYNNTFQIIGNMSYLDERNKTKFQANGKPEITYNNRMLNRPWLFGNLEFNIRKNDLFQQKNNQLKLAYFFQYVHWFYLTWKGFGTLRSKSTIPTQYMNNVQLTYSLDHEKYNISLEAKNIFDLTLYDNYMMQKPGRSFFLKLRMFIN
jgi:outer membrane cobalamin receptor